MALDFPSSPTVGQQYPNPPVTGSPVYVWNGNRWVAVTPTVPPFSSEYLFWHAALGGL